MPHLEVSYIHAQAEVDRMLLDAGFDLTKPISRTTPVGDSSIRIYEQELGTAGTAQDGTVGAPRIEDVPIKDVPAGEPAHEHPQDTETAKRDGHGDEVDPVVEAAERKEEELARNSTKAEDTKKDDKKKK